MNLENHIIFHEKNLNHLQGKLVHFNPPGHPEVRLLIKGGRARVNLRFSLSCCVEYCVKNLGIWVLVRHNHHERRLNVGVEGVEHQAHRASFFIFLLTALIGLWLQELGCILCISSRVANLMGDLNWGEVKPVHDASHINSWLFLLHLSCHRVAIVSNSKSSWKSVSVWNIFAPPYLHSSPSAQTERDLSQRGCYSGGPPQLCHPANLNEIARLPSL